MWPVFWGFWVLPFLAVFAIFCGCLSFLSWFWRCCGPFSSFSLFFSFPWSLTCLDLECQLVDIQMFRRLVTTDDTLNIFRYFRKYCWRVRTVWFGALVVAVCACFGLFCGRSLPVFWRRFLGFSLALFNPTVLTVSLHFTCLHGINCIPLIYACLSHPPHILLPTECSIRVMREADHAKKEEREKEREINRKEEEEKGKQS